MTAHVSWYAVKTQAQADPYMNAYTKQLPKMTPTASPEYNLVPRGRYTAEPRYNEPLYKELSPRYNARFSLPK